MGGGKGDVTGGGRSPSYAYVPVISGRREDDYERFCAMERWLSLK